MFRVCVHACMCVFVCAHVRARVHECSCVCVHALCQFFRPENGGSSPERWPRLLSVDRGSASSEDQRRGARRPRAAHAEQVCVATVEIAPPCSDCAVHGTGSPSRPAHGRRCALGCPRAGHGSRCRCVQGAFAALRSGTRGQGPWAPSTTAPSYRATADAAKLSESGVELGPRSSAPRPSQKVAAQKASPFDCL